MGDYESLERRVRRLHWAVGLLLLLLLFSWRWPDAVHFRSLSVERLELGGGAVLHAVDGGGAVLELRHGENAARLFADGAGAGLVTDAGDSSATLNAGENRATWTVCQGRQYATVQVTPRGVAASSSQVAEANAHAR